MKNTAITAPGLPALGPYSHAVQTGSLLFLSGQTPLDPKTGELAAGGIQEQTRQCFENIARVLAACQLKLTDIIKTTVFLVDMQDFAAMNEEYACHINGAVLPARSTVAVAGLPLGAQVEIECVVAGVHQV